MPGTASPPPVLLQFSSQTFEKLFPREAAHGAVKLRPTGRAHVVGQGGGAKWLGGVPNSMCCLRRASRPCGQDVAFSRQFRAGASGEQRQSQLQENSLSTPQKRPVFRHPKSKVFIANRATKAPLSLGVLTAPPFPLGLCGPPGRRLGRPPPPRGGYRPISGRARPPAPPASTAPQPGPGIDSGALKPGKAGMLFKTPLLLGDPKRDPA